MIATLIVLVIVLIAVEVVTARRAEAALMQIVAQLEASERARAAADADRSARMAEAFSRKGGGLEMLRARIEARRQAAQGD